MASTYVLIIQSAEGVSWNPGPRHQKMPNLCVAVHQQQHAIATHRTQAKRSLAPQWTDISKISAESDSCAISLRLVHHSALPGQDECLGVADTTISELLEMCVLGDKRKFAKLRLRAPDYASSDNEAGALSVHLMREADAAASALEHAQVGAQSIQPGPASAAIMNTVEKIMTSSTMAAQFQSALSSVTTKLKTIVQLGDEIAKIHPYANVAWKVLTSVYKAAKHQQDADEKLLKLVETMNEVYAFVEDIEFLAQKIQSLEDNALAIVKQTVECALFIQEYTTKGFCSRALRNTWTHTDKKIDDLVTVLLHLKDCFESRLTVQSLFLSTKMLQNLDSVDRSDTLRKLNPVEMNAASRSVCFPGTCREILQSITEWLYMASDAGNVLWLSGVAGSGKSTISTTISESCRELERLGAFLFFDRNDLVQSHPNSVIRTLAYLLAQSNPHVASAICVAIRRDPTIVTAPLRTQFRALLSGPLQAVEASIQGPIVIILDALDECGDASSRKDLISLLAVELPKLPHLFRFLITSRSEKDITTKFQARFTTKHLDVSTAADDIMVFLRHEIGLIQQEEDLDPEWPGKDDIQELVKACGGLFIWAATAVRFIALYDPEAQLRILLNQNFIPESSLDHLYAVALQNSGPWDKIESFAQDARAVLACVVLGRIPMTERTIDALLGKQSAKTILKHLGCVVQWTSGGEARALHASFADYLTDSSRSGKEPWGLNTTVHHCSLALGCFQILNKELQFNICALEDSHVLNSDVPRISECVAANISPSVSYSSCFWFNHIQEASFEERVLQEIKKFFNTQLLHWLEALSLLEEVQIASTALNWAARYVKNHDNDLADFISDSLKFVSAFAPLIAQSAPHIYLSALAFTPPNSRVAQQFHPHFPRRLYFDGPLGMCWPSLQKQFRGHTKDVLSVRFSPDGTKIVSGSADYTIRIWDAETGMLIMEPLLGHTDSVQSVDLSPTGSRIVSGSNDTTVRIWDTQTGAPILGPLIGHTQPVKCVSFSPNGAYIASGSSDCTLRMWNANTGALVTEWEAHTNIVASVHFSPNGKHVVSGSHDNTVVVWDVQTGEVVTGPLEHPDFVFSVNFSRDGSRIVSACRDDMDHMVRVWDAQTGELFLGPLAGHTGIITSVHFSPNGTRIASASWDRTVRLWDAINGDVVGVWEGHNHIVQSVHFSPNGDRIVSGSEDHTIHIWDAQSRLVDSWRNGEYPVYCVNFSPDGNRIAGATCNQEIRVWDSKTGALVAGPFVGHTNQITDVQFSGNGNWIASSAFDGTVRVWDAKTGSSLADPMNHSQLNGLRVETFSIHDEQITTISEDSVRVWDAHTGVLLLGPTKFNGHPVSQTYHGFSQGGAHLVAGSRDNIVCIWASDTGTLILGPLEAHQNPVTCVDFSVNHVVIVSGYNDSTLQIHDARTGALLHKILASTDSIWTVKISPDGAHVVSGSRDGTLSVWETKTGALVSGPLEGHIKQINYVRFSSDGTHIASVSDDDTIRVWNMEIGVVAPGLLTGTTVGQDAAASISELLNPLGDSPTFDQGGWLLSGGVRVLWVPPWLRQGLYLPRNTLVIREQGTTKLDLTQFVHGLEWQNCIDPEFGDKK